MRLALHKKGSIEEAARHNVVEKIHAIPEEIRSKLPGQRKRRSKRKLILMIIVLTPLALAVFFIAKSKFEGESMPSRPGA